MRTSETLQPPVRTWSAWTAGAIAAVAVIAALWAGPVPQDPAYHEFTDTRTLLGIANFWNVTSNLPFALIGAAGLLAGMRGRFRGTHAELNRCYLVFFAAMFLVAAGSSYYHLAPSTERLFWDRLPMGVAFMALFSALVGESLSPRLGNRLLAPLVMVGAASVVYWHITERLGVGDLRPYGMVQFGAIAAIAVLLLARGSTCSPTAWVWAALGCYVAAKLAEHFDAAILSVAGIGGHAFKHLLAALSGLVLLAALKRRHVIAPVRPHQTLSTPDRPASSS